MPLFNPQATTDPRINAAEADVASAATCDIYSATTENIRITGTTTITSFGSTAPAGTKVFGRFAGVLTLTHNGTSLILPDARNIVTSANDSFVAVSLGSGNWIVVNYTTASINKLRVIDLASGGGTDPVVITMTTDLTDVRKGDLMFLVMSTDTAIATPSGWTLLASSTSTTNDTYIFYQQVNDVYTASYSISVPVFFGGWCVFALRNSSKFAVNAFVTSTAASGTLNCNTITNGEAGAIFCIATGWGAVSGARTPTPTLSPPSGYSTIVDVNSSGRARVVVSMKEKLDLTATGTVGFSFNNGALTTPAVTGILLWVGGMN